MSADGDRSAAGREQFDVGGVLLPRPYRLNRLGHLGLYVADLEASHVFYGDLLGFRVTDNLPGDVSGPNPRGRFYTYNTDHHALVLIHNSVGRARDDRYERGVTINQMSFQVGSLEEVVNAHRLLRAAGANIWRVGRDVPGSNWAVYFRDSDDHTVELFYGMEQIGWDRLSKPLDLFGRFRTIEEPALPQPSEADEIAAVEADGTPSLSTGSRSNDTGDGAYDVGGVRLTRPFKIIRGGPISLFVKDLDAAVEFYRSTMGFSLTEEVGFEGQRLAFLRLGAEHHTVALVPIALRDALGLNRSSTLLAQGLQVGSYRQLRSAVAFLEAAGCSRVRIPAAFHTGVAYAAHFRDPDGHLIQLYFEMESIGWDGRPRPAEMRRTVDEVWPEVLDAQSDTYADRQFLGPIG